MIMKYYILDMYMTNQVLQQDGKISDAVCGWHSNKKYREKCKILSECYVGNTTDVDLDDILLLLYVYQLGGSAYHQNHLAKLQ